MTEDKKQTEDGGHNQAAILSMTEVPGTQVVYKDKNGIFFGEVGFLRACKMAVSGELPEIKLPEARPTCDLTLEEAIKLSCED